MRFPWREWLAEMASGTVGGALAGAVGAAIIPGSAFGATVAAGAIGGLIVGAVNIPIKIAFTGKGRGDKE